MGVVVSREEAPQVTQGRLFRTDRREPKARLRVPGRGHSMWRGIQEKETVMDSGSDGDEVAMN